MGKDIGSRGKLMEKIMAPENLSNVHQILCISENTIEFLEIVAKEIRNTQFYHNADWRKVLLDIFEKESSFSEQPSAIICTTSEEDNLVHATEKTCDTDHLIESQFFEPPTPADLAQSNAGDNSVDPVTNASLVNSCKSSKDLSLKLEPGELFGFLLQPDGTFLPILSDTISPEPEFLGFSPVDKRPAHILEKSITDIFAETLLSDVKANISGSVTESPISQLPETRNSFPIIDFNHNMKKPKSVTNEVKSAIKEEFIHISELVSETKIKIIKLESEQTPRRSIRSTSAKKGSSRVLNSDKENKTSIQPPDKSITRSQSFKTFKPKILFTKCNAAPYIDLIQLLGGQEVNSPLDCNVLISNKVHTTYKFLSVMSLGVPIISENWLREMKKTGKLMPHDEFALCDSESEKFYKFVLSKTLAAARKKPLYSNYSILVTANTQPRPEELSTIITCAGGHLLTEEPRPGDKVLAISTTEDSRDWPSIQKLFPDITIISTKGFMISIMKQHLQFSKSSVLA